MDRISGFSDELLLKILLYVPTKVAVSTSILSKRWEYLWMWLPKLEYRTRYCSEPESKRLQSFLDRNLPLHRAPVIERIRLDLGGSSLKPENVNMWVVHAIYHKVRELEIEYDSYPAKSNILPSNLFTCKSLVVLKLNGEILLDVPRMASLPSLKNLKLENVRYFNGGETLTWLLSSCPILEDLVVDIYDRNTRGKLTVAVPSLRNLSFCMLSSNDIEGYVIETPCLKYFKLEDYNEKSHYCLIETMPNLVEAHVDVELDDITSVIALVTSVKRLSICSKAMVDEGFVFNQLEHLEVCLCKEHFSNQLFRLLKVSSKLKRLDISLVDGHDPHQYMDDWNQPSTVPECMLSSLQTLNCLYYTGTPQERDIMVYILKHALHLKTATIKSFEWDVPKFEMLQELSLSSRASATCQLMFECAS